jgi:hypothetical protein
LIVFLSLPHRANIQAHRANIFHVLKLQRLTPHNCSAQPTIHLTTFTSHFKYTITSAPCQVWETACGDLEAMATGTTAASQTCQRNKAITAVQTGRTKTRERSQLSTIARDVDRSELSLWRKAGLLHQCSRSLSVSATASITAMVGTQLRTLPVQLSTQVSTSPETGQTPRLGKGIDHDYGRKSTTRPLAPVARPTQPAPTTSSFTHPSFTNTHPALMPIRTSLSGPSTPMHRQRTHPLPIMSTNLSLHLARQLRISHRLRLPTPRLD